MRLGLKGVSLEERSMPNVPNKMTAVEIVGLGGPEELKPVQSPTPHPNDDEVLVRVAAAGINGPDVLQSKDRRLNAQI
jgi:NADPH2:quinone reductase